MTCSNGALGHTKVEGREYGVFIEKYIDIDLHMH
jgi:hypothetical protein